MIPHSVFVAVNENRVTAVEADNQRDRDTQSRMRWHIFHLDAESLSFFSDQKGSLNTRIQQTPSSACL